VSNRTNQGKIPLRRQHTEYGNPHFFANYSIMSPSGGICGFLSIWFTGNAAHGRVSRRRVWPRAPLRGAMDKGTVHLMNSFLSNITSSKPETPCDHWLQGVFLCVFGGLRSGRIWGLTQVLTQTGIAWGGRGRAGEDGMGGESGKRGLWGAGGRGGRCLAISEGVSFVTFVLFIYYPSIGWMGWGK